MFDPFETSWMYMFHIELVIKMEALYSKLYDKYTKLKVNVAMWQDYNPKKYCVRPNTGIVMPRSSC
ncbi:vesicle-associated protein 1-1, partial [Quercus suber]